MSSNTDTDDARLSDIQKSVHEIHADVRGLERRIDKTDARVSDIERQVIQATANQSAVEAVMGSENRRLTDKIELVHDAVDRVDSKFGEHIRREDADRRAMLSGIWSLAIAVVTAILGAGWWLVTKAPQ